MIALPQEELQSEAARDWPLQARGQLLSSLDWPLQAQGHSLSRLGTGPCRREDSCSSAQNWPVQARGQPLSSSGLARAGMRTAVLELYLIPEANGHSSSVRLAFRTRSQFSGESAALKGCCLSDFCRESPLASTSAAPFMGSGPFHVY